MARQRAGECRLGDPRHRHAEVEGGLHRPRAGALGAGRVEDHVDERLTGRGIHLTEHLGGDLDEIRLELAAVPLGEDVGDLRGRLARAAPDEIVGLGDQLHVGVLDAVVHHLDEVAGTVVADVRDARLALGDRCDALEDRAESHPRLVGTAGHERGAEQGALLTAGDAHADEVEAALAYRLLTADGVGEERVAAVDDDVARLEDLHERLDHRIRRTTGFDHDDSGARLLQRGRELPVAERGHEPGLGVISDELVGLRPRPVEHRDRVAFARGEIASEVRSHHRESDDSDVGGGLCVGLGFGHGKLLRCGSWVHDSA